MDQKGSALNLRGTPDRANDYLYVWNGSSVYRTTINNELGIVGVPVGTTDSQTLTNKTLTAPTLSSPVFSGTITGTYTLAGTPTFPSSVVTLTGSQTLTNKTLTSPTINTPTITNASITQDAVTGFTSANSGTVYGIPITASKLPGTSITNSTVGPNQLATGAASTLVTTTETTTSTSYTALATPGPAVTVTIGANGLALVTFQTGLFNSGSNLTYASVALSGANTVASSDTKAVVAVNTNYYQMGTSFLLTGLAAGSTTFTMQYKVGTGTGSFNNRLLSVVPL